MAWYRTDGAFPFYWWEASDISDEVYDGAFPVIGGPDTEQPGLSALGHQFTVAITNTSTLGHQFTILPRQTLLKDMSKITRKRLR